MIFKVNSLNRLGLCSKDRQTVKKLTEKRRLDKNGCQYKTDGVGGGITVGQTFSCTCTWRITESGLMLRVNHERPTHDNHHNGDPSSSKTHLALLSRELPYVPVLVPYPDTVPFNCFREPLSLSLSLELSKLFQEYLD
ncbi:hypothetical protein KQX54_007314 [Cotesia glomerata]|uniref:Uncharacterized protein n=1 Tax=Cotesia glomerata TaxID=32391 RepID=A0AAV7I1L9_COTGL|nr:hypothetical protein KQX54_007314 [Cotesia glomerata]